jgi:hypothetical protein
MNLDRTFQLEELPRTIGEKITELAKDHVIGLVNDYNETLRKQGLYIEFNDQEELVKHLLSSAKIKLKIATDVDEAKLEKWHIALQSATQTKLAEYEEQAAHVAERRKRMEEQAGGE